MAATLTHTLELGYLSFSGRVATLALTGSAKLLPRMICQGKNKWGIHSVLFPSQGGQSRSKSQCTCQATLEPMLTWTHEDILKRIVCEMLISYTFKFCGDSSLENLASLKAESTCSWEQAAALPYQQSLH